MSFSLDLVESVEVLGLVKRELVEVMCAEHVDVERIESLSALTHRLQNYIEHQVKQCSAS